MMKYLKNFSLLFLIFIISKTFSANANNIYFINSTANNLTENDQYSLNNFLDIKRYLRESIIFQDTIVFYNKDREELCEISKNQPERIH